MITLSNTKRLLILSIAAFFCSNSFAASGSGTVEEEALQINAGYNQTFFNYPTPAFGDLTVTYHTASLNLAYGLMEGLEIGTGISYRSTDIDINRPDVFPKFNTIGDWVTSVKYKVLSELDEDLANVALFHETKLALGSYRDDALWSPNSVTSPGDGQSDFQFGAAIGKGFALGSLVQFADFSLSYTLRTEAEKTSNARTYDLPDFWRADLVYMFYGNEYFSSLLISSYIDHFSSDDVEEEDTFNIGIMFSINLMEDVSMPVFYNYSSLDVQNVTSQHTIGFNIVYTYY